MEIQNNKNMDLEVLLSLDPCEAEEFLNEFLEDETSQLKAPRYMKQEILEKCRQPRIQLETKLRAGSWHTNSQKLQLFCYSLRVGVAVVFALFFLFPFRQTKFPVRTLRKIELSAKFSCFWRSFRILYRNG